MTQDYHKTRDEWTIELGSFENAVEWAKTALIGARSISPKLFQPGGYEQYEDGQNGKWALNNGVREIAENAITNYRDHCAMKAGCASFIRNNKQLPDWAATWLANFLIGSVPAPKAPRGVPSMKGHHDHVCRLIDTLVEFEWVATRNDATAEPSACDVLAEALSALSLKPSTFEGVKRIYIRWTDENGNNEATLRKRARTQNSLPVDQ